MIELSAEEEAALALLAENRRLLITIVPNDIPDRFMAKLTVWQNFCLDTRLLPPLWIAATRKGDGLVCPYCGVPASAHLNLHLLDCEWREGAMRYGAAMLQIDEEFPEA